MKVDTNRKKIQELVNSRFIYEINCSPRNRGELKKFLESGRRLTLYHGIDPTAPDLHLGHSTNFLLMREFQKLGHRVVLLIGDFTARIGDPTGKDATRKPLSGEEVKTNMKTYLQQIHKLLPKGSFETRYNSSWLSKMSLEELIKLFSRVSVARLSQRNLFRERMKRKKPFAVHEFLYPLMQGYDSVALETDIEIGGVDQSFNMMIGRELVKDYLKKEKLVITTPLLVNPKTGRKLMSKSEGGYISLQDSPNEMFGKIMALDDAVIIPCLELCTLYPQEEIEKIKRNLKNKKLNPRDAKMILAFEIVSLYHGRAKAKAASEEFERVFKAGEFPDEIPQIKLKKKKMGIVNLLIEIGFAPSKSAAARLVKQGGVRTNGDRITNPQEIIEIPKGGIIIRVGKRRFAAVKP